MVILAQFGVGLLAILFYNVFKFHPLLKNPGLLTRKFWNDYWQKSRFIWIWSVLMLLLISVITNVLPGSPESISTLTGLAIGEKLVSFFTLGLGLSSLVDTEKP